jgi:hypothetical protein
MLVRDGNDGKCDTIVDTGMAMYKNTIIGGMFWKICLFFNLIKLFKFI